MDDNNVKNEWFDPDTMESEFGIKKSTQAKLRMRKEIPYSKIGKKLIKYNRAKINDWLEAAGVVL